MSLDEFFLFSRYSRSEIRFNLMAIIKNRISVCKDQLQEFENQRVDVNTMLMVTDPIAF